MYQTRGDGMYEDLIDEIYRRYRRIEFRRPGYEELEPGTVLGGAAWSRPGGTRWIVQPDLCLIPGIGVTHLDLARWWVRQHYDLPIRRRRTEQQQEWAPVPTLVRITRLGDGAYVDIKSAYRKIVSTVGWDCEYWRGRYVTLGGCDVSELTKLAYSAVVAIAARTYSKLRRWNGTTIETVTQRNMYANPSLYRLVRDVLWAVYSDIADNVDIRYYNTDGCIVHSREVSAVQEIMSVWGFEGRVKERGEVVVYGHGSYSVGEHQTRRWTHTLKPPTSLMPRRDRRWLYERYALAARSRAA